MKIIEITGEPIVHGGQEKLLANIFENMDRTGLQIDVLTPYGCYNAAFQELLNAIDGNLYQLNLPFRRGKSRRLLLSPVTAFLRNNSYDVAHIHSGSISALAYCALAAKRAGVRRVIVHSHSTGTLSVKRAVIKAVFGLVMRYSVTDYLACSIEAGRAKFVKAIVDKRLFILKNGIPIHSYQRDEQRRAEMRMKLGIPDGCFVLGHVGRFSEEKNHRFLLEVYSLVHKALPLSRLLLVGGDGELREEIGREVELRNLSDSTIFTGNVDNVQDYYQAMDCFLLPSLYEGFGLVALEAQAAGLPCVISTGVPADVAICSNVYRLALSDDTRVWADTVLSMKDTAPADNAETIQSAGYDIEETAAFIRKLYLS